MRLAIIAWQKPNLLLLDEPTNHLDLDMRLALTMALQSFEGAMILVSHDRNLIRSTTDELYLVHDGVMEGYGGDLEDYSQWLIQQRAKEKQASKVAQPDDESSSSNSAQQRKDAKRLAAEKRQALRPLKQKAEKLEKQLEQLQTSLQDIELRLSDSSVYEESAKEELKDLLTQQTIIKRQIDDAEEAWMEALEQLEAAEVD